MDILAQLLDLVDDNSTISESHTIDNVKYITVQKNLFDHFCPLCGSKLHSKGTYTRSPNHQILQDGYTLSLTLKGRRWKCSGSECSYQEVDKFNFIEPRKKITSIVQFQILMDMKDIDLTAIQVAEKYHVSDTYVHNLFMKHVNMPRLPLAPIIAIDEVYLNISPTCKYALVIMDFESGEIIDILPSRRKEYTESYFLSIPYEERKNVTHLICDMYSPYINYTANYFPNAIAITDSFHVLQWLLRLINQYINSVKKKYQERDRKQLNEKNYRNNTAHKTTGDSPEVYILKHGQWVLLRNRSNWEFKESHYVRPLNRYMDTLAWETAFLELDSNFKAIRDLKDLYEEFNESYLNRPEEAAVRLNELIEIYRSSKFKIFVEFASLLIHYHDTIINSFICISGSSEDVLRRLSNGPLESFNNIPSRYRSSSHGVSNFDYTRNRLLWSVRKDASIRAVARRDFEIKTHGKKRGKYNKQ